jgi:hypothetical protein
MASDGNQTATRRSSIALCGGTTGLQGASAWLSLCTVTLWPAAAFWRSIDTWIPGLAVSTAGSQKRRGLAYGNKPRGQPRKRRKGTGVTRAELEDGMPHFWASSSWRASGHRAPVLLRRGLVDIGPLTQRKAHGKIAAPAGNMTQSRLVRQQIT